MGSVIDQVVMSKKQLGAAIFRANQLLGFENGEKWHFIIKPWRPKRSLAQNRLYWAWMRDVAVFTNESRGTEFSDEDMHEYLKELFLPSQVVQVFDKKIIKFKTTTKLSIGEFTEYLESIEHWCGAKGIPLTQPECYQEALKRGNHERNEIAASRQ